MYTFRVLQILIFLIPGFISAKILDTLIVRKEGNEFEKIVEALIFSMLIYTIYSVVSGKGSIIINQDEANITYSFESRSFLWLGLFSISIPLLLGLFITNDWHMKLARKLKISKKTARKSTWWDVFSDKNNHYVIINFVDKRRLFGWPEYYSNHPDNKYIYLKNPAWIKFKDEEEGEFVYLKIDGILITPDQKIESIEFIENMSNGAANG